MNGDGDGEWNGMGMGMASIVLSPRLVMLVAWFVLHSFREVLPSIQKRTTVVE